MFSGTELDFLNSNDLGGNAKYELFHDAFIFCFNKCFPERQQATRKEDLGIKWFNDSLKQQRNSYNLICDLYSKYRTDDLLNMKKRCRLEYYNAISVAKVEATSNYISNSNNKIKSIWNVIKSVKGTSRSVPSDLDPDALNRHFVEHPLGIVRGLPAAADSPLDVCTVPVGAAVGFSLSRVSGVEVRNVLMNLKQSGTRDIYGVSTRFIKCNVSLYVPIFLKLINSTLESGEFPDLLKQAYVIPVHKSGQLSDITNYRPITVVSTFSKVYERSIWIDHKRETHAP